MHTITYTEQADILRDFIASVPSLANIGIEVEPAAHEFSTAWAAGDNHRTLDRKTINRDIAKAHPSYCKETYIDGKPVSTPDYRVKFRDVTIFVQFDNRSRGYIQLSIIED